MQCDELKEYVLTREEAGDALSGEAVLHVRDCPNCTLVAGRFEQLDSLVRKAAIVEPPLDLQAQLTAMALAAAVPEPAIAAAKAPPRQASWRWPTWTPDSSWLPRTNLALAQVVALVLVSLASWQVYQFVLAFSPILGSPLYALELVATSPAMLYVGGLVPDVQMIVQWSIMALFVWAFADRWSSRPRQQPSLQR